MRKKWSIVFLLMMLTVLSGCNFVTVEETKTIQLDASGLETFLIQHDEGDVTITGVEGLDQIEVEATLSVMSEEEEQAKTFLEEHLSMNLTEVDEGALLTTAVTRGAEIEQGNIHLKIKVPNDLKIDYKQNEGQLKVNSMTSDLVIEHGSDHLFLDQVNGTVKITDGAGKVTLTNVSGNTTINNASGETSVTKSSGNLSSTNGSGALLVEDYQGEVTVRNGSGNIKITGVDGNVTVVESQQGSVTIEDVSGQITQP